jgi:hypothetical protein
MATYCTYTDVLKVAQEFKRKVVGSGHPQNDNTIPAADVTAIAAEASQMVNALLQPRYKVATIEAYTTYPPVIVYLTAAYSAVLMNERYGASSVDQNKKLIDRYSRSIAEYKAIIQNGALVDSTGAKVPTQVDPVILQDTGNFVSNDKLSELYEDGRTY